MEVRIFSALPAIEHVTSIVKTEYSTERVELLQLGLMTPGPALTSISRTSILKVFGMVDRLPLIVDRHFSSGLCLMRATLFEHPMH